MGSVKGVDYVYRSLHDDEAVILNTSTGLLEPNLAQPGQDPSGKVKLFLEGEIYNREKLRQYLTRSSSDSICDVLATLYLAYGYSFVELVNGEFNIII